jgi:hypothetical protein
MQLLAPIDLKGECEESGGTGVTEVLTRVHFEFAKPLVNCIAMHEKLFGRLLGRTAIVKPDSQGLKQGGAFFIGDQIESGKCHLRKVLHEIRSADRRDPEQVTIEDRHLDVDEAAGERHLSQCEGFGSITQIGVCRAYSDATNGTARKSFGEAIELSRRVW